MHSRAIRRQHRARLKEKRKRNWNNIAKSDKWLGKLVDTPTPCSCAMCGNPRRHSKKKLTLQEEKLKQKADYDSRLGD